METYSAEGITEGQKFEGIIENLTKELKGNDVPFTWGARDIKSGMFFLMEPDCEEMWEGARITFNLNSRGKISKEVWDSNFHSGAFVKHCKVK